MGCLRRSAFGHDSALDHLRNLHLHLDFDAGVCWAPVRIVMEFTGVYRQTVVSLKVVVVVVVVSSSSSK